MNDWYSNQKNVSVNPEFNFATVVEVDGENGIRLKFEDANESTSKFYPCANGISVAAGDKVKIFRDSGTCVVEYKVGLPGASTQKIKFKINNTEYRAETGINFSSWISSADNTAGYSLMTYLNSQFLTLDESTPAAFAGTENIVNNKNYTMTPQHFSIAGIQQDIYEPHQLASAWINIARLNTGGYTYASKSPSGYTSGYYFCLNGNPVAFLGTTSLNYIEIGHNYTMNG